MLNDRDGKYEGHDESEYHFTDDDISYEVEPESAPKQPTGGGGGGNGPKESITARLSRSKRVLISAGVFIVLVFVVYKMVVPTTTSPNVDISATAPSPAAQQLAARQNAAPTVPIPAPAANVTAPTMPVANTAPESANPSMVVGAQAPVTMTQPPQQVVNQQTVAAMPAQNPNMQAATGMPVAASAMPQPGMPNQQQQVVPAQTQPIVVQQPIQTVTSMPSVIPVQSATPSTMNQVGAPMTVSALGSDSDRLIAQMQAEYLQKLNEYAAQTKATQDQLQSLNARVVNMEAQLNQIVQALTQHRPPAAPNPAPVQVTPAMPQHHSSDTRQPYTVQAIIPGRAWLRSDSGETITVAEGDSIRELGRVTKIDPYDGVVEVNTGTKVVSLSYGNSN